MITKSSELLPGWLRDLGPSSQEQEIGHDVRKSTSLDSVLVLAEVEAPDTEGHLDQLVTVAAETQQSSTSNASLASLAAGIGDRLRAAEERLSQRFVENERDAEEVRQLAAQCSQCLNTLETKLSGFQDSLAGACNGIESLQLQLASLGTKLKNRKALHGIVTGVVEHHMISPDMVRFLVEGPVSSRYVGFVSTLSEHLSRINKEADAENNEILLLLSNKVAARARQFFISQLRALRTGASNIQQVHRAVLLKHQGLVAFLKQFRPNVAREIQDYYVGVAKLYYKSLVEKYTRLVLKLQRKPSGKGALMIGCDQLMRSNMLFSRSQPPKGLLGDEDDSLSVQNRIHVAENVDAPLLLPKASGRKLPDQSAEALFRCIHRILIDAGTAEWDLVASLFEHPNKAGSFVSRDSEVCRSAGDGRSFRHAGSDISSSSSVFKHTQSTRDLLMEIMGPCIEFVLPILTELSNSTIHDTFAQLIMLRVNQEHEKLLEARGVPGFGTLTRELTMILWPRVRIAMGAQVESLSKISSTDKASWRLEVTAQRFSQYVASVLKLNARYGDTIIDTSLDILGCAMQRSLRIGDLNSHSSVSLDIHLVDLVLQRLQPYTSTPECRRWLSLFENALESYADSVLEPLCCLIGTDSFPARYREELRKLHETIMERERYQCKDLVLQKVFSQFIIRYTSHLESWEQTKLGPTPVSIQSIMAELRRFRAPQTCARGS